MENYKYKYKNCKEIDVTTAKDFINAWNSITKAYDVHLFIHGGEGCLYFKNSKISYLTPLNKGDYAFSKGDSPAFELSRLSHNSYVVAAVNSKVDYTKNAFDTLLFDLGFSVCLPVLHDRQGYWAQEIYKGNKQVTYNLGKVWDF